MLHMLKKKDVWMKKLNRKIIKLKIITSKKNINQQKKNFLQNTIYFIK
jgi:hypothetical protein